MPLTVAVFLVVGGLASGAVFAKKTGTVEERGVLGGPVASASLLASAEGAEFAPPSAIGAPAAIALAGAGGPNGGGGTNGITAGSGQPDSAAFADAVTPAGDAVQDLGAPVGPSFDRSGMITYTVKPGDNLSKIAAYFGISINTIVSANPGLRANFLRIGQTLNILPTSGVVYASRAGDTLQSIADLFGISQDKILQFNGSVNFSELDPGTSVIIPGGTANALIAIGSSLPNFNSQFVMPANGYNWGILHHYNAVDIADSCGTPVVAAAEGLVVPDPNIPYTTDGWNEGYGNFVLIEHPFGNGVETRYAHLSQVLVQVGDYVKQGQEIGLMGETGDATGCHVHFEVIGAQNPFAKG